MTLFEIKEKMATMQAAILADANWLAEKAADPTVKMDEINEKKAHRDEMQSRYDLLKAEHDALEKKQLEDLVNQGNKAAGTRARKAALELSKLMKEFRKVSVEAAK